MIALFHPDRLCSVSRLLTFLVLALLSAAPILSQTQRPDRSLYVLPRIGLSNYIGDVDSDFDLDEWDVGGKLPLYGGLEVGLQLSPRYALAVGLGALDLADDVRAGSTAWHARILSRTRRF